jgi:hypothetical protein
MTIKSSCFYYFLTELYSFAFYPEFSCEFLEKVGTELSFIDGV